jgi:hypothetical protein
MMINFHNDNVITLNACLKDYFLQNLNLMYCTCKPCEYNHLRIAVAQMT